MKTKKALILVDIQNDFLKGGSLEVPFGNEVIAVCNELMLSQEFDLIVATQDWHPANHSSFKQNSPEGIWPVHCVQDSFGALLHKNLNRGIDVVIKKGENPLIDSYSGFFDNDKTSATDLDNVLKVNHIKEVIVVGLALDYCVKFTALDAVKLGYKTSVKLSATRAVNLSPMDGDNAIKELQQAGVMVYE